MTEEYCLAMSNLKGPAMTAIRLKMMATDWPAEWEAKKTMFTYGEEISTDLQTCCPISSNCGNRLFLLLLMLLMSLL